MAYSIRFYFLKTMFKETDICQKQLMGRNEQEKDMSILTYHWVNYSYDYNVSLRKI